MCHKDTFLFHFAKLQLIYQTAKLFKENLKKIFIPLIKLTSHVVISQKNIIFAFFNSVCRCSYIFIYTYLKL